MTIQELKNHLNIEDKCISQCNPQHVVSENKMAFRLNLTKVERKDFWVVNVDNCMMKNSKEERCDYTFLRFKNESKEFDFYYIELKNNRIQKAFDQIVTTIQKHFKNPAKKNNYGFIVSSSVPSGTLKQNLQKDFIRKYGVSLTIKNENLEHIPL
jgi:hypothetical protein